MKEIIAKYIADPIAKGFKSAVQYLVDEYGKVGAIIALLAFVLAAGSLISFLL